MNKIFKILILFPGSLLIQEAAFCQKETPSVKGNHFITLGHGYRASPVPGINYFAIFYEKSLNATGPFRFKYEYGVTEKTSLGIGIGYYQYTEFNLRNIYCRILGKISHHFQTRKKWAPYCDIGLGIGIVESTSVPSFNSQLWEITRNHIYTMEIEMGIGTRYYFKKNLGLYIETGIGKNIFNGGLVVAF